MRALTISAALLVIDTVLLPATANYEQWEENRKDISYCDTNEDTIVSYGDGEYYVCQKMPILIGQEESSKGLWIRWTCDDAEAPFDESVCKPPLEGPLFDPQMKPMMDQMVFCKEDGANEDNGYENIPESLSCDLESSPFIPDADVIHHYYECQSINWNIKCGQWHLRTCYDQQSFDSYTQECKADQQQYEEGGVQMRQAFMSYATGTYAYTSQVPTYGYTVPYAQPAVPMYTYQRTYPVGKAKEFVE